MTCDGATEKKDEGDKKTEADEHQPVASTVADTGKAKQPYEASNEGEYHYAAVEDQD